MTPEQIAKSRARCEAATKGPWRKYDDMIFSAAPGEYAICECPRRGYLGADFWADNREFIINARTDLPAALDALEQERKRIAELEADNARLRATLEKLLSLATAIECEVVAAGTAADCVRQYVKAALEGK